MTVHRWF